MTSSAATVVTEIRMARAVPTGHRETETETEISEDVIFQINSCDLLHGSEGAGWVGEDWICVEVI